MKGEMTMTIQDLIDAGITFQGDLTVRVYDDSKTDGVWTEDVFTGNADAVDMPEYIDEPWFCDHEISYIYSMEQEGIDGWCIEVQPCQ